MKRILILSLTLLLLLGLCACGAQEPEPAPTEAEVTEAPTESIVLEEATLGTSIETDILRITLTNAQLAIKLNSSSSGTLSQIQSGQTTLSDEYFTAEEYDPVNDVGLAYVAAKGHTYVAIEYQAENLDRASVEFDGTFNDQFITVEYAGNTYNEETNYGCRSVNGYEWERYNSGNVLLLAGDAYSYRGYIDIPVDAEDLNDDFSLIFSLPNSKGETTKFKYVVTAADRNAAQSQEISVDEAIHLFTEEEGQQYFKNHMDEYTVLNGEEIKSAVEDRYWDVVKKLSYGSWTGGYKFETDGRIKETIPSIGTGYYNDCTWSISDDMLVLDGEEVCQVRQINDASYLLVLNDEPYAIMN